MGLEICRAFVRLTQQIRSSNIYGWVASAFASSHILVPATDLVSPKCLFRIGPHLQRLEHPALGHAQ